MNASHRSTIRLTPSELNIFSSVQPGRTPLRIAVEIALIAAAIGVVEATKAFWALPFAVVFIASRQHALLILMHECAHYRATQTRWLNTALGESIGWAFLMSMRGYRRHHAKHHIERNINTMADPDFERLHHAGWRFPMSRRSLAVSLLKDIFGLNTVELLREARDAKNNVVEASSDVKWLFARLLAFTSGAVLLTLTHGWRLYIVYWLIPVLTVLKAMLRIRAMVDHFALETTLSPTRTVIAPWHERFLLAPCSIGIHQVHHQHTSVPYYHLRAAHQLLWTDSVYRNQVQVSPSYLHSILHECCPKAVRS